VGLGIKNSGASGSGPTSSWSRVKV